MNADKPILEFECQYCGRLWQYSANEMVQEAAPALKAAALFQTDRIATELRCPGCDSLSVEIRPVADRK